MSKQMPVHSGDNFERSDTKQENDTTIKRTRNDASVSATASNSDEQFGKMTSTVDHMPSEVLEAILCNLATLDLVNSRQINRKWNEISSRIMRQRADIQIVFSYLGGELMQLVQHPPRQTLLKDFLPLVNELHKLSFVDLIDCLKQSINFPFTSFRFKDFVEGDAIEELLSIWGQNIYALGVKIETTDDVKMLKTWLEKTPKLKKLHIDFGSIEFRYKVNPVIHPLVDSNKSQLPELKVLRVTGSCEYFFSVIVDIVKLASNLNCFEKCALDQNAHCECINAKELAMLHSLNKLHCIKDVSLLFKEKLIDLLETSEQIMDMQLKSIELSITWIWNEDQLSERATKIINKLFDSSKHSLRELTIPPLGLLSGVLIPKFENLQNLYLMHDESYEDYPFPSMFPPLFDIADHFPNVRKLSVALLREDNYFSTYQPLNVMPKVELLKIDYETEYEETLMKLTPNATTLLVGGTGDTPPTMNFKAIAMHLKKLENLGWQIFGKSQHDFQSSCVLDSVITGFPKTFCQKMSAQFRDKEHLSPQTVASLEKYRNNFSILNLIGLRRCDMSFTLNRDSYCSFDFNAMCSCEESDCECGTEDDESDDMAGFHSEDYLYQKCLTKVSQFLAFNLMPDLDVNVISRYLPRSF